MNAPDVLRAAAAHTGQDERPPKHAVQTLWSRLHAGDPAQLRDVFDTLASVCGVSDPIAYLGPALRRMTPVERADACLEAADRLEAPCPGSP